MVFQGWLKHISPGGQSTFSSTGREMFYSSGPQAFGTRDWFCGRQFFHGLGWVGWFGGDSSALHSSSPHTVWPSS